MQQSQQETCNKQTTAPLATKAQQYTRTSSGANLRFKRCRQSQMKQSQIKQRISLRRMWSGARRERSTTKVQNGAMKICTTTRAASWTIILRINNDFILINLNIKQLIEVNYNQMTDLSEMHIHNPYLTHYLNANLLVDKQTSKEQATDLVRHLGCLHNTIGKVFHDIVKILDFKDFQFQTKKQRQMIHFKQQNKADIDHKFKPQKQQNKNIFTSASDNKSIRVGHEIKKQKSFKGQKGNVLATIKQKRESFDLVSDKKQAIKQVTVTSQVHEYQNTKFPPSFLLKNQEKKAQVEQRKMKDLYFSNDWPDKALQINRNKPSDEPMQIKNHSDGQNNFQNPINNQMHKKRRHSLSQVMDEQNNAFDFSDRSSNQSFRPIKQVKLKSKYLQIAEKEASEPLRKPAEADRSVRVVPGRKKKQRQQFKGIECLNCQKFYNAFNTFEKEGMNLCQCTSRHKSNLPFEKKKPNNFTQQFDFV